MKRFSGVIGALALAFASTGAYAVSMQSLLDGDSLQVGDKLFSDWVVLDASLDLDDWALDYTQMDVTGDASDPMNIGLNFDMNGQLAVDGELNFAGDFGFAFTVTVLNPGYQIVGVGVELGDFTAEGFAFGDLYEAVDTSWVTPDMFVSTDGPVSDSTGGIGASSIRVEKNFLLGTLDVDDFINIETFSQTFEQAPVPAPIPATLTLLGLGLAGLGWVRRKA